MRILFKYFWVSALLLSLFLLVGAKIKPLGRFFLFRNLIDSHDYGNLYDFCKIDDFRSLPFHKNEYRPASSLQSAKIISFGDSFFNTAYDSDTFTREFEKCAGLKMMNVARDTAAKYWDVPLLYFQHSGYRKGRKKYLLLETVETYSLRRALSYKQYEKQWDQQRSAQSLAQKIIRIKKSVFNNTVANFFFQTYDIDYFFRDNFLIYPVNRLVNTLNFRWTGKIDSRIARYSTLPKMLFFDESVAFDQKLKSSADYTLMVDNLVYLAEALKERYNIELVYLIIPNKYTLYHALAADGYLYDDFIPYIYRELAERGVPTIDIFQDYLACKQQFGALLYYPCDTHYNKLGKSLLVEKTAQFFTACLKRENSGMPDVVIHE